MTAPPWSSSLTIKNVYSDADLPGLRSQFVQSSLLRRLITLYGVASHAVKNLPLETISDLRIYYNHALMWKRAVVSDIGDSEWRLDLISSLAAVLFATERISKSNFDRIQVSETCKLIIQKLREDIHKPWFSFALRNARRPTLIGMSSLPGLNLGDTAERFYVQSVSESWPTKKVSHLSSDGKYIEVDAQASRRFVDNDVAGDLGHEKIEINSHERSFLEDHSIGWVTRYETPLRKVTVIEVDPITKNEIEIDLSARRKAHKVVMVEEQRLDMYSLDTKMHQDASFNDNFVLSRMLAIIQSAFSLVYRDTPVDIMDFINVNGTSKSYMLGPVDEEVLIKSLGSMTAKNKIRSALSISAKARLTAIRERGNRLRGILGFKPQSDKDKYISNEEQISEKGEREQETDIETDQFENDKLLQKSSFTSRLVRCGIDGIYVRTRVPYDTLVVVIITTSLSIFMCRFLISSEGRGSIGEALSLGLGFMLGVSLTYHNLRYNSWSIAETVRLKRTCTSDEQMRLCMSENEMVRTIAEAGAKGARMDGILTCAFSNTTDGKFSVTAPLRLDAASRAGLKLRVSSALMPLWIDLKGVREASDESGIWHSYGDYLEKCYLNLSFSGASNW